MEKFISLCVCFFFPFGFEMLSLATHDCSKFHQDLRCLQILLFSTLFHFFGSENHRYLIRVSNFCVKVYRLEAKKGHLRN